MVKRSLIVRIPLGTALLITLPALNLPLFAHFTSVNLAGTVYDSAGWTVPKATIVARNTAAGIENTSTSTSDLA